MSGHRRVKDISYEDDDFGDYYDDEDEDYGQEELSPEDQEQMRVGKIKVREVLGPNHPVTDKEIEDALWNAYYNIEESVASLRKLRSAQTKNKQSAKAPAKAAQPKAPKQNGPVIPYPVPFDFSVQHPPPSAADFFSDLPWHRIPTHRRSMMVEVCERRGGLLGGSSKPSKLAALAAARKKKEEQKAAAATASTAADQTATAKAVALLDRLGSKPSVTKDQEKPSSIVPPTGSSGSNSETSRLKGFPLRKKPTETQSEPPPPAPEPVPKEPEPKRKIIEVPRAAPSGFAAILVGTSTPRNNAIDSPPRGRRREDSLLSSLYSHNFDLSAHNPFADPSPDDMVLNAQAKGAKAAKSAAKPAGGDKAANGLAEGVAAMSTSEAVKVKSKNLNVKEEYEKSQQKNAASFIVIGHVDHGKSTLMGRLLYDLKVIDQRSVDKLRRDAEKIGKGSFALAWVMDQTSEERERGVTVDIATNSFETDQTRFTILDAPGHQDFIPNMIAGASQADFAVLVIDSGINSFESGLKGQTKEHVLLVKSMGVQRLIVAVNKMDTVSWSKDRFEEIEQQMSAFFKSVGFQPKKVAFIPCAGLTGENIVKSLAEGVAPWYKGHTLVEELDASETNKRALDQPLRLNISDIFRGGITNPLSISGRIDSGSLQIGDPIIAMPSGEKAFVKGIEVDKEPVDWAVAGQIATLHLTDIDQVNLRPGDIICSPSNPIKNAKSFITQILAFEHVMPMYVDVHRGRLHAPARITKLLSVLDKKTGQVTKKKPRVIQPGSVAKVVVELDNAIPLEARDKVVLRSEGHTIAAGLLDSTS